ncbi:MAG: hypothetical protein KZQ82_19965, partial [Candidatus Thiodiazotropha sp. (ex Lucinoma annulata)]|nr:hypothetical protein [Candidatus Thiodiazotropha sp. (ex Lucinoma annulata)]
MDKELADSFHRLEMRHDQVMQLIQSQHHLNQVVIGALLERGAVDRATFLEYLYSAMQDLDVHGAPDDERLFVDLWFDT